MTIKMPVVLRSCRVLGYPALIALCLLLYLPGFMAMPPFDRDEARFAQASAQMIDSGDVVDIRFQDESRYKKPIGIYWMQAAATTLADAIGDTGNRTIWTYRIPSLVGAITAVLLTAWVGSRLFGATIGFGAALMLASCVLLGVEARMAKTDAVLLATVVAAQGALATLYLRRDEPGSTNRAAVVLLWVAIGVGVLIKGPVTAMVSLATAAALAVWDRRVDWLKSTRPLLGLAIVAVIAAPWLIAIAVKTGGAFFSEAIGHDMLGKVAGGQEGKGLPPGYYLLTFWITFAPWSFLALAALPWVWRHRRDDAVRFCICWIVPTWIIFEAVPTKLLHYTLPTFPAVAMLALAALRAGAEEASSKWWWRVSIGLGGLGWIGIAATVALVPWLVDGRIASLAIAIVIPVLVLFGYAARSAHRSDIPGALLSGVAGALVLFACAYSTVLPATDGIWVSRSAKALVFQHGGCADPVVASAGYSEPSLIFLLGTNTVLGDGGRAAEHLRGEGACALALVEAREDARFHAALGDTSVTAAGSVQGFNYNTGRRVVLTLYRRGR